MRRAVLWLVVALLLVLLTGCAGKERPADRQIGFVHIIAEQIQPAPVPVIQTPDPRILDDAAWERFEVSLHPVHADGELFRPLPDPPSAEALRQGAWSFRYLWRATDQETVGNSFPRGVHGEFYQMNLPDGRFALVELDRAGRMRVLDHGMPRCMFSGPAVTTWEIAGDRLETLLAPPFIDLSSTVGP